MIVNAKAGFTLIEVLVVMVIIGVMVTLTTLTVGDSGEQRLKREAQRLSALLRLAQEEAVFQSQQWGLSVHADHYQFSLWQHPGWQVVKDDDRFRPRSLPQGVQMELQLEGTPLHLDETARPQILILSSGECTPFELTFRDETDNAYQLRGNLFGEFSIH